MIFDRTRWPLLLTLILALGLALTGCSDDDDDDSPTGPGGGNDAPVFESIEPITVPQAMQSSSDPGAIQATAYVTQINALTNLDQFLIPPSNKAAADGPPWVSTWTYDGDQGSVTATLTIDEVDGFYTWELVYSGTMDGETYEDAVIYTARRAVDGSSGDFYFYDPSAGDGVVQAEWHWTTNSVQSTFEYILWDGDQSDRLMATVLADNSGSLDIYEGSDPDWQLTWHCEWTAVGSGEWVEYDNGAEVDSGSWNVPTKAAILR